MNVVVPRPLGLVSSNAVDGAEQVWSASTTYSTGARVRYEGETPHRVYEAVAGDNRGITPGTDPLKWVLVSASNRWAMLDSRLSSATKRRDSLSVTLSASKADRLVLLGLVGERVSVTVRNGSTVITQEEHSLRDGSQSSSWTDYFFTDIAYRDQLVIDIPGYYNNLEVDLVITAATGTDAACGHCVIGRSKFVGLTKWGTKIGMTDASRQERNEFGEVLLQQRPAAKAMDVDLWIDTHPNGTGGEVARLYNMLTELRATPCVWDAGNPKAPRPERVLFGFYKDFSLVVQYAAVAHCSLEIEGLI